MRASELRPGQFFEPIGPNVNGRCLWIGTDDDGMLWAFKHNGRLRHCWTDEDFDVTPLNVHGWDDEPQSEPAPLQLREGARFLMRQHGETGPLRKVQQEDYVWSDGTHSWSAEGRYWASGWDSPYDLIAEVLPPVEPPIGSCVGHSMGPAMVEYRMRDGGKSKDKAVDLRWHHSRESDEFGSCMRPNDITHYRLVKPAPITPVNECSLRYWWVQWVTPPTLGDLMATTNKRGEP